MKFPTERLILRSLEIEEAPLLLDYLIRNKDFLAEWEPIRNEDYFTIENIRTVLQKQTADNEEKKGLHLYLFTKDDNMLFGNINITNIIFGPFQSCFLAYKLDKDKINRGYITEGLREVINICFNNYLLHRIEANIIPRNIRSIKVVKKLGFEYEGSSKKYLKINGVWEDHHHYVLLNEKVE